MSRNDSHSELRREIAESLGPDWSPLDAPFIPEAPSRRLRPPAIPRRGPSRNEHFISGALSSRDPRSLHPNLHDYQDGGMGGDENHSVVGFVPTHTLAEMPYNDTDREGVERHKEALLSGRGFEHPIVVRFDPRNKRMVVGDGNHRVQAALELGISHVPARVNRAGIDDDDAQGFQSRGGHHMDIDPGPSPFANQHDDYWPSDIHPSHLFRNVL